MIARVDGVTFDHWNTLVFESDVDGSNLSYRRIDAWVARLGREGLPIEPELLRGTFATTWEAFTVDWHAGVQRTGEEAARHALSILELPITDELHGELVEHFVNAGRDVDFSLAPGIEECLRALKAAGVKLGIVCDVGFTPSTHLRDHLERRGLLEFFDGWSFSDDVGYYKPAREIFDHALASLGHPTPSRVAHVGDLRRTDVAGALDMGMIAVRYAGVFDDPAENGPEATFTITDYAELPGLLGLEVLAVIAANLGEVLALYQRWGAEFYDEEISQLAHAEQTAALAARAGAADALVAAALLHDVGHLIYLSAHVAGPHEQTGPDYLRGLFGADVLGPISEHVRAKRALCALDDGYYDALSEGSKRSLERQGGPLGADSATRYAQAHADALALRRWDDEGKVDGLVVRPIGEYRSLLESLVS